LTKKVASESMRYKIGRTCVLFIVLPMLCKAAPAQVSDEKWKINRPSDWITGEVVPSADLDINDRAGRPFRVEAICDDNAALAVIVKSLSEKLDANCSKARLGLDHRLIEVAGPSCDVRGVKNYYKYVFPGDITKFIAKMRALSSKTISSVAPETETARTFSTISNLYYDLSSPLLKGNFNTLHEMGLPFMNDVLKAKLVQIELPLADGKISQIELYPQDASFKEYAEAACVEGAKAAGAVVPRSIDLTTPKTVTVPANQTWTPTGILLTANSKIDISATGSVYMNGAGPLPLGPDGVGPGGTRYACSPLRVPAKNLPCWTLIGRIGDQIFLIGIENTFSAPASGQLFLGINGEELKDNTGAWTAIVSAR
jgi:hypothetical protein